MQAFGAMGMTKELPLKMMANNIRVARVYEGPSEVHRMLIARYALQGRSIAVFVATPPAHERRRTPEKAAVQEPAAIEG